MSAATASNLAPFSPWQSSSEPEYRQNKMPHTPAACAPRTPAMLRTTSPTPPSRAAVSPRASRPRTTTPAAPPLPTSSSSHPHQDRRAPSPHYFGLAVDAAHGSAPDVFPTSATVRSVAATSPRLVRPDSRSGYEAFRKRSDQNTFTLAQMSSPVAISADTTPKATGNPGRRSSAAHQGRTDATDLNPLSPRGRPGHASPATAASTSAATFASAAAATSAAAVGSNPPRSHLSQVDDRHARLSLPPSSSTRRQQPVSSSAARASTLPARTDQAKVSFIEPSELATLLEEAEKPLILDVRVVQQFARSSVAGALNLCIPTTLLKRPSYNVEKLATTFTDPAIRARFER